MLLIPNFHNQQKPRQITSNLKQGLALSHFGSLKPLPDDQLPKMLPSQAFLHITQLPQ
jgi:hypothetical protein